MKSIIQKERRCLMCGSNKNLEKHHVFGASNRKWSEADGLTVDLCHWCHNEPPNGVHHNKANMERLHKIGQRAYEETHTRAEFIARYGRNYLED